MKEYDKRLLEIIEYVQKRLKRGTVGVSKLNVIGSKKLVYDDTKLDTMYGFAVVYEYAVLKNKGFCLSSLDDFYQGFMIRLFENDMYVEVHNRLYDYCVVVYKDRWYFD